MLSAFKNFGITFLISAVFFGIIAYFATGFVTSTMTDIIDEEKSSLDEIIQNPDSGETDTDSTSETDTVSPDPELQIPEGESFNFLVISTDYRPDLYTTYEPSYATMSATDWNHVSAYDAMGCLSSDYRTANVTSIVLVCADKEDRQFVYTYFTPLTRVYTTTGYHTLSEVYSLYGKQTVADYVHSLTGVEIKYTFLLNAYNLDEFADMVYGVTVNAPKDVYSDGKYNTLNFETTVEREAEDGTKWTEHIPNSFIISAGEKYLDFSNLYHLTTVIEHSSSDLEAKATYMTQMIQRYLEYFASLEESQFKTLIAKLITRQSEWGNIDSIINGTQSAQQYQPQSPLANTAASGEKPWIAGTFEPDTPILETDNYTMNDFDSVVEMIGAVKYFENKAVVYPFTYYAATETEDEYFNAEIKKGLEIFMEYRADVKPASETAAE